MRKYSCEGKKSKNIIFSIIFMYNEITMMRIFSMSNEYIIIFKIWIFYLHSSFFFCYLNSNHIQSHQNIFIILFIDKAFLMRTLHEYIKYISLLFLKIRILKDAWKHKTTPELYLLTSFPFILPYIYTFKSLWMFHKQISFASFS